VILVEVEVHVVIEHQVCPVYEQGVLEGVRSISVVPVTAVVQQDTKREQRGVGMLLVAFMMRSLLHVRY